MQWIVFQDFSVTNLSNFFKETLAISFFLNFVDFFLVPGAQGSPPRFDNKRLHSF